MIRPRVLVDVALTLGLGAVLAELLWIEAKLAELQARAEPLTGHEWRCPSCNATTRARMADHPSSWGEHPFGTQG